MDSRVDDPDENAGGGDETVLGWLGLFRKFFLDYDREDKKNFSQMKSLFKDYPLLVCYSDLRYCSTLKAMPSQIFLRIK